MRVFRPDPTGPVTVALPDWTRNVSPSNPYEFSFVYGSDRFDALRHRTDWGWSWWEIFRAGKLFRSGGDLNDPLVFTPTASV